MVQHTQLKSVCEILNGYAFKSSNYVENGIRVIRITNVQKGYIEDDAPQYYPTESKREIEKYMLREGDLLMSLTGNVGRVAVLKKEMLPAALNQRVACLRVKESANVYKPYLFHLLNSDFFENQCIFSAQGIAQKNMSTEWLKEYQIPLYSMENQRAIADLFDRIDSLIGERKEQKKELDLLVKSRFLEQFGDPKQNPFGWNMTTVGALVASCEAGWSGNGTQREKKDGEIAVLKVSAVTKGYFIPEESKVLDDQGTIKKYVYPQAGDLLFSRANTREMVGATAVITQDYPEHILPDKLWKIRFLDKANVWYMKYVLSSESIRSIFSSVSTGTSGSMFNVSMDKFKSIRIPLPPLDRQQQFAAFVAQTDKSKLAAQKGLQELEILKKSLMQQYFG